MDDNEFRKRAFSDPHSDDPDLHRAARSDSARMKLMEELSELEEHIRSTVSTVAVPADLAERLKQQIHAAPPSGRGNPLRYFAVAASTLVIAAALLLMIPGSGPSSRDQAFHDNLVAHLHQEAPAYEGDTSARWSDASGVLAAAGIMAPNMAGSADGDRLETADIKFAQHCDLGESGRGVHIVMEGEHGPVSVILTRGDPVEQAMTIDDERFHGRITPTGTGNMAVVGEQGEQLSEYATLVADHIEWPI